jgi:hypothetical protein
MIIDWSKWYHINYPGRQLSRILSVEFYSILYTIGTFRPMNHSTESIYLLCKLCIRGVRVHSTCEGHGNSLPLLHIITWYIISLWAFLLTKRGYPVLSILRLTGENRQYYQSTSSIPGWTEHLISISTPAPDRDSPLVFPVHPLDLPSCRSWMPFTPRITNMSLIVTYFCIVRHAENLFTPKLSFHPLLLNQFFGPTP